MTEAITLSFVGDFCSSNPKNITSSSSLQEIWQKCDINYLNFEGPLNVGEVHTANKTILHQSNDSPLWCADNGFNVVSLANNHAYDFGEIGMKTTRDAFEDKVITLGVGNWNEAYSPKFVKIKGKTIGFLAFTSADLSSLKDKWTDKEKFGTAWINYTKTNEIIRKAKDQCDYLFVICHAGLEFLNIPLPEWRDRYRDIIDCGATAVIAMHPHTPQGWEHYNNGFILYSLGNFYFDWAKRPEMWDDGLLAYFEILNENISLSLFSTKRIGNRIDINKDNEQYIQKLHQILCNDDIYINEVNTQVLKFAPKYESWFLSGIGAVKKDVNIVKGLYHYLCFALGIEPTNYRMAMHQLREESTRYALTRAYKLMSKTDL